MRKLRLLETWPDRQLAYLSQTSLILILAENRAFITIQMRRKRCKTGGECYSFVGNSIIKD